MMKDDLTTDERGYPEMKFTKELIPIFMGMTKGNSLYLTLNFDLNFEI